MPSDTSDDIDHGEQRSETTALLQALLEQAQQQTRELQSLRASAAFDACLLDKIGRIACMTANETHRNAGTLTAMSEALLVSSSMT